MFKVQGLSKSFAEKKVLDQIDLTVNLFSDPLGSLVLCVQGCPQAGLPDVRWSGLSQCL